MGFYNPFTMINFSEQEETGQMLRIRTYGGRLYPNGMLIVSSTGISYYDVDTSTSLYMVYWDR